MDEKPRKSQRPKKKITTDKINPHELLQELLKEKLGEESQYERMVRDLNQSLIATLSEFLSCYILLGYDFEGNPSVISYSKNDMHHDALNSLLFRFFTYTTQKYSKPPPPDSPYD